MENKDKGINILDFRNNYLFYNERLGVIQFRDVLYNRNNIFYFSEENDLYFMGGEKRRYIRINKGGIMPEIVDKADEKTRWIIWNDRIVSEEEREYCLASVSGIMVNMEINFRNKDQLLSIAPTSVPCKKFDEEVLVDINDPYWINRDLTIPIKYEELRFDRFGNYCETGKECEEEFVKDNKKPKYLVPYNTFDEIMDNRSIEGFKVKRKNRIEYMVIMIGIMIMIIIYIIMVKKMKK